MDFLDENNYNSCTRRGTKSCFKLLGRYLEQSGYEYTPEIADEWFRLIEPDTSVTYASFYRSALIKLCDMYETGDIRKCNNGKNICLYPSPGRVQKHLRRSFHALPKKFICFHTQGLSVLLAVFLHFSPAGRMRRHS